MSCHVISVSCSQSGVSRLVLGAEGTCPVTIISKIRSVYPWKNKEETSYRRDSDAVIFQEEIQDGLSRFETHGEMEMKRERERDSVCV